MSKDKEPIEVPASIAKAYRNASLVKRKRAERAMEAVLILGKEASSQLQEMVGTGAGLYGDAQEVDKRIQNQRNEWEY